MLKIAIVGVGYWGKNLVRVFSEMSDVVSCVHNGNNENESWIKETYPEVNITTNYSKVVSNAEIDAIVIATPIGTHYELVHKALLHNKHVFVEKPLAESAKNAKFLSSLAIEKNRVLFTGYIFAYHPLLQPLFERSKSSSIIWCEFKWNKSGDLTENIFLDVISHPVAVSLALFNEDPMSTSVNYSRSVSGSTDIISLDIEFGGGVFSINVNRLTPLSGKSLQILFEDGQLFYWNEQGLYRFDRDEKEYIKRDGSEKEPLQVECERFISAINEGGEDIRTDGEFSYRVNDLIEQIEKSI